MGNESPYEKITLLFHELMTGEHEDVYGSELDGLTSTELAQMFLAYYDEDQFTLMADNLFISAAELKESLERLAQGR